MHWGAEISRKSTSLTFNASFRGLYFDIAWSSPSQYEILAYLGKKKGPEPDQSGTLDSLRGKYSGHCQMVHSWYSLLIWVAHSFEFECPRRNAGGGSGVSPDRAGSHTNLVAFLDDYTPVIDAAIATQLKILVNNTGSDPSNWQILILFRISWQINFKKIRGRG